MSKEALIKELSRSSLIGMCPKCDEEFKLKDAIIFDGLKPFPKEALDAQKRYEEILENREKELLKKGENATTGAKRRSVSVSLGKILEVVAPAYRNFGIPLGDCRSLYQPIDLIAFNGLTKGKINSVTFLEIKTGRARLSGREEMIKEAVDNKKVRFKVMK